MIKPEFTNNEAIALEHLCSTTQTFVSPKLPLSDRDRLEAIRRLITPDVLSALGKIHMELDNMAQVQQMLLNQRSPELGGATFNLTEVYKDGDRQ